MDARLRGVVLTLVVFGQVSLAATVRTPNFTVTAESPQVAQQVAQQAEASRRDLAVRWLGRELPKWYRPCPIHVTIGEMGAGGATSFTFDKGHVFNWDMKIQGPLDRVLDSVVPHEVSHTIFACHFRRPLPRWADEGAATLAENESEKMRQMLAVKQILASPRRIPFSRLLGIMEYPSEMQEVLTLYAEGYSLAELLIQKEGPARYLQFLQLAHEKGWETAFRTCYGYKNVAHVEHEWSEWILAGAPPRVVPAGQQLATNAPRRADETLVARGQTPEEPVVAAQPAAVNAPGRRFGRNLEAPQPLRERPAPTGQLARPLPPPPAPAPPAAPPAEFASRTAPAASRTPAPVAEDGWRRGTPRPKPAARPVADADFLPPFDDAPVIETAAVAPPPASAPRPPAPRRPATRRSVFEP